MVFGNHRERQIDASRDTAGGDEIAVLHENLIGLDSGLGKAFDQAFGVMPVSGHAITVQQPGMPEHERAGADRPITVCAVDGALKPFEQRWMFFFVVGSRPTWHQ